ncbi:MAG: glutamate racemase [Coxiella sp. RIFCSPHIGHO2_12_FULL_42_15]|nr:MAG: glutamate racemase [Coxiella sp. RIFCSPHIGHO2_12_FULL_42_15]
MTTTELPIGVFDSGMGGLTVMRELMYSLPNESFIYLGDTARLPYGTKSQETVKQYALQMATLLIHLNIKLLVIACNTATTAALSYLQQQFPHLPIIGVVEPGAQAAVNATHNKKIALLATETTIRSGIYQKIIQTLDPEIEVFCQSCGLFVALAEEGCINDEIAQVTTRKYLAPLLNQSTPCDVVILGCTHFPVLSTTIAAAFQTSVSIINSGKATAKIVTAILQQTQLLNLTKPAERYFLVTDLPERFVRIGEIFLKQPIDPNRVMLVDGFTKNPSSPSTTLFTEPGS